MNLHDYRVEALLEEMDADEPIDFWSHVDTQRSFYAHVTEDSWVNERGPWCLAANGKGDRCAKGSGSGPFCGFHMDRVRLWFEATARRRAFQSAALDVGIKVADAARVVRQAQDLLWAMPEDRVYFWELEGQGVVKIGHSRHVATRTKQFLTGKGCAFPEGADPSTGHLLGTIPGGGAMEKHLHAVHRRDRLVGEWFKLSDSLADDIASLLSERESTAERAS